MSAFCVCFFFNLKCSLFYSKAGSINKKNRAKTISLLWCTFRPSLNCLEINKLSSKSGGLNLSTFVIGAFLCIVGCLAVSMASTQNTIVASPIHGNQECLQTLQMSPGGKITQVENHRSKWRTYFAGRSR